MNRPIPTRRLVAGAAVALLSAATVAPSLAHAVKPVNYSSSTRADRGASGESSASQIGQYRWIEGSGVAGESARGGGPIVADASPRYVHERYSRDLDDGCEYRADVRGHVRSNASTPDDTSALGANLTVRADLHCPNVAAVQAPARRVAVQRVSRDELAQRVSSNAEVRATREGQRCTYRPQFAFREGTLVNTDVAVACGGERR